MSDHHLRSVCKAVSYRVVGTLTTILIAWIVTGRFKLALTVGMGDVIAKIVLFYLHERAWNKISLGKSHSDYEI